MSNYQVTEEDIELAKKHTVNDVEYNAFLCACALKNQEIEKEKEEEAISFGRFLNFNPEAAKAIIEGKSMKDVYKLFKQQDK